MEDWITQLRKVLMELYILNPFKDGESYGYEIMQSLHQNQELVMNDSTVYPNQDSIVFEK